MTALEDEFEVFRIEEAAQQLFLAYLGVAMACPALADDSFFACSTSLRIKGDDDTNSCTEKANEPFGNTDHLPRAVAVTRSSRTSGQWFASRRPARSERQATRASSPGLARASLCISIDVYGTVKMAH